MCYNNEANAEKEKKLIESFFHPFNLDFYDCKIIKWGAA